MQIILAPIHCRLESFPGDIFCSSEELKETEGVTAIDCEEEFGGFDNKAAVRRGA